LKQSELAKVTLRKETPLIQIIDRPILPLAKERLVKRRNCIGRVLAGFFNDIYNNMLKKISITEQIWILIEIFLKKVLLFFYHIKI
jgi:hypothetical protein